MKTVDATDAVRGPRANVDGARKNMLDGAERRKRRARGEGRRNSITPPGGPPGATHTAPVEYGYTCGYGNRLYESRQGP